MLATDGYIIYDIQEEEGRTTMDRPFPFMKTLDPAWYASLFLELTGKQCVVYKCVVEDSMESFDNWINNAHDKFGHSTFNLVGAATSKVEQRGPSLVQAMQHVRAKAGVCFGCVCIPERHSVKGNENLNMVRKIECGAEWFISQGIYASGPIVRLIRDYASTCREKGIVPKKIVLTFAPCGREKTMTFIKWLGMEVPEEVSRRILGAEQPVQESIDILCQVLTNILAETAGSGVSLGLNVESLSIFKDEIDGAHELFQRLQAILLRSRGSPWSVKWYCVKHSLSVLQIEKEKRLSFETPLLEASANTMDDAVDPSLDNRGVQPSNFIIISMLSAGLVGFLLGRSLSFRK